MSDTCGIGGDGIFDGDVVIRWRFGGIETQNGNRRGDSYTIRLVAMISAVVSKPEV